MISYSQLRHAVILASPKPKPIVVERKGPSFESRYSDYSNCHKAMTAYAEMIATKREKFRVVLFRDPEDRPWYRFEACSPTSP
jgi:hypothetical protein